MSAIPDDLEPVLDAVAEETQRQRIEDACRSESHPWTGHVGGDEIHGVVGRCECGRQLYDIDGRQVES